MMPLQHLQLTLLKKDGVQPDQGAVEPFVWSRTSLNCQGEGLELSEQRIPRFYHMFVCT